MNNRLKRHLLTLPLAFMAGYICLISFLYINQSNMIYFPVNERPDPAIFGAHDVDIVTVTTEDGLELEGWYKPALSDDKPVMIVFHGNAGHIGYRGQFLKYFGDLGMGVLLAEYRGYGGNPGKPSERGLYKDARAYLDFLIDRQNISKQRIILYGESLGTGVAVQMAFENPADQSDQRYASLILEAPYTSLVDVAQKHYSYIPFLDRLIQDKYESDIKIDAIETPLLVLIAGRDNVIPNGLSETLFQKAPEPKTLHKIEASGHNDFYQFGAHDIVLDFLKKHKVI